MKAYIFNIEWVDLNKSGSLPLHTLQIHLVIPDARREPRSRILAHLSQIGEHHKGHVFYSRQEIECYDNGGKTADRYTVVYMYQPYDHDDIDQATLFYARGMSDSPFHPQGVGMMCSAMPGRHLGKRITFDALPADCQKLVMQDCRNEET